MRKKAQIKLMETVGVLLVFFVLLAIGMIFYGQYQKSEILKQQRELIVSDAISKTIRIMYLSELQCTRNKAPSEGCIDIERLKLFNETIEDNMDYYKHIFGNSKIVVRELYPHNRTFAVYEVGRSRNSFSTPIPVTLYDPVRDLNYFGVLNVEIYS